MGAKRMPAPNEMSWYKWWPAKCLTSLRWTSLTVTEEGVYRRMYDLASLAQPSERRGYFYEHDIPADIQDVWKFLRIDARTGQKCLDLFAKMGLMEQDKNGAWGFANFAKHQRGAYLRPRPDGLGSAEVAQNLEQNRAIDKDKEEDKEEAPPLIPPEGGGRVLSVEDDCAKRLANIYRSHCKKPKLYGRAIECFHEALNAGMKARDIEAAMMALQGEDRLSTPWEIITSIREAHKPKPQPPWQEPETKWRDLSNYEPGQGNA